MSTTNSNQPILIVGAGLAGLSLGLALRTQNIPFQIFERDATPSFRAQGYRIRIQDFYLRQLLPLDLWTTFEKCCPEFIPGGCRLDAITGRSLVSTGPPGGPPTNARGGPMKPLITEGKPINVDRRVLRNLMMAALMKDEGLVHFGKRFSKYELIDDGVLACFDDGTQFKGRLLIGADGSKSMVRKQLLPNYKVYDTEGRSIFGKTLIDQTVWDTIPEGVKTGMSLMSDLTDGESPMRVFCEVMRFQNRDQVDVDLPADYMYWVLSAKLDRLGMPDQQFMHLTGDEALAKTLDLTMNWDSACRSIVQSQLADQTSTLSFAIADPQLENWPANDRVTLMGDAAHPMTPVGGVGANAAFLDATLLLKAITTGGSLKDITEYEETMRQHARRFIAGSASGATHMFNMKPIDQLKPLTY